MHTTLKLLAVPSAAIALGLITLMGCTTDDNDPGAATGGAGGAGGAGGSSGGSGGSVPAGSICAGSIVIPAAKPGVADFDTYAAGSDLTMWNFPLGGDAATGVTVGTFAYGDRDDGFPQTYEMSEGHESAYAFRIADMLAEKYGGGFGTWLSACLDVSAFQGVSFWVRGNTPNGKATFTLQMGDTLPTTPMKAGGPFGTCPGSIEDKTCVHPTFVFDVTDTWTQIELPWTGFTAGSSAGKSVKVDGKHVTQLQFGANLAWTSDAAGVYAPTPAPYELVVDSIAFY
jgi:hypothetical protein